MSKTSKTKPQKRERAQHVIMMSNSTPTALFVLCIDIEHFTWDILTVPPGLPDGSHKTTFLVARRSNRIAMGYEFFRSTDDALTRAERLMKDNPKFKQSKPDHIHCSRGGKDHVHDVDELGLKKGPCDPRRQH